MTNNKRGNLLKQTTHEVGPCIVLYSGLNSCNFDPLASYLPECLLPIGTVPILHLAIARHLKTGFRRIIIYACSQFAMVEAFVNQHYWAFADFIKVVNGETCTNVGDIIRDIDSNELFQNTEDFVFAPVDLLVAANMLDLFNDFLRFRTTNPHCVIGVCMASLHKVETSLNSSSVSVSIRDSDSKLIHYSPKCPGVLTKQHKQAAVTNLTCLELGLLFCSKHIPPLFTESFDYTNEDQLFNGILVNEEIINYTIKVHILDKEQLHFRMACDLSRLYDANRLFLSNKLGKADQILSLYLDQTDSGKYQLRSNSIFISSKATVSPSVKLCGYCFISKNCVIEDGCILIDTVLGPGCVLRKNTNLRSVICTNDVTFDENTSADKSFICAGVRIFSGVLLAEKTFIGPTPVRAPRQLTLGPNLSTKPRQVFVYPASQEEASPAATIGTKGWAKIYEKTPDFDDDPVNPEDDIWKTCIDRLHHGDDHSSRPHTMSFDDGGVAKKLLSKDNNMDELPSLTEAEHSENVIIEEIKSTIERSLNEKISSENTVLDINGLKHAYAQNINDIYFLILKAIIALAQSKIGESSQDSKKFIAEFKKIIDSIKSVILHYYKDSEEAQMLLLESLEDSALTCPVVEAAFTKIIYKLYEDDVITETAIREWHESSSLLEDEDSTDKAQQLRSNGNFVAFMKWLDEADEEDDDDD